MIIKPLDREKYAGMEFTTRYMTGGCWDIKHTDIGFEIAYKAFDAPVEKSFVDTLFGEWLENPVVWGAFDGDRLVGIVEGSMETWNNRFRISNICIFEESDRRGGLGKRLMDTIIDHAKSCGARMAVLETQTCNEKAICFYKKMGFQIIGFDMYSYTNSDPEKCEVRLEMGRFL